MPKRFEQLIFQVIISALMSCLVSGTVSFINLGASGFTLAAWMKAWIIAWSIALPAIVILSPIAKRLAGALVK